MARFSGQIHSAKFIDVEEKVIEVLYGESPESLNAFNVPVDYTNNVFIELLQEITIEEVQDQTKAHFDAIVDFRNQQVHSLAKEMFEKWVAQSQDELDKQDKERYEIFEEYKNEWLDESQKAIDLQVEMRYKEADKYKESQVEILQKDIDSQVEARYAEVEVYKESQLAVIETEVNTRAEDYIAVEVEKRFAEVDAYKSTLQAELDAQVQERYQEQQAEIDLQVQGRFQEADKYKQEQLLVLQAELDAQVEQRYEQVENFKEQEIEKAKSELKSKLKVPTPAPTLRISTDSVLSYLFDRIDDEDTVFKAKLAIFDKKEVKNHKDRALKMRVRKAKTIPELFAAYNECLI